MSRMHWLAVSSLVGILVTVLFWWQAGAVPVTSRSGSQLVSAEQARVLAVRAKIRRELESDTEVDFVNTPLHDGLQYLSDYHEIQILVDERALTDAGVPLDTPVTLSLSGVTLEATLNLLLKPLQLDYLIDDNTLRITTRAQERVLFDQETYPLRDLFDAGFNGEELRAVLLSSVRPLELSEPGVSLRIEQEDVLNVRHHPSAQRELARTLEKLRAALARRRPAMAAAQVHTGGAAERAAERLRSALREPTELDFLDTPLRDGLSYLRDYHSIPIWADEQALTDEGVPIDMPVTLSLEGVRLEEALNRLLAPLQLDIVIEDEVLKVTTMVETYLTPSAEFYSVSDLLDGGYDEQELQEILLPCLKVEKPRRRRVRGWGVEVLPPAELEEERPTLRLVLGDLLAVWATSRGHRQLVAALDKLRAAMRK